MDGEKYTNVLVILIPTEISKCYESYELLSESLCKNTSII